MARENEESERNIMFLNLGKMDATARAFWEFTCNKIMAQSIGLNVDPNGGAYGGNGGGEHQHGVWGDGGIW